MRTESGPVISRKDLDQFNATAIANWLKWAGVSAPKVGYMVATEDHATLRQLYIDTIVNMAKPGDVIYYKKMTETGFKTVRGVVSVASPEEWRIMLTNDLTLPSSRWVRLEPREKRTRPLKEIAAEIVRDWPRNGGVPLHSRQWVAMMRKVNGLNSVTADYDGRTIVQMVLAHTGDGRWHGPVADRVRAELQEMLK